MAALN